MWPNRRRITSASRNRLLNSDMPTTWILLGTRDTHFGPSCQCTFGARSIVMRTIQTSGLFVIEFELTATSPSDAASVTRRSWGLSRPINHVASTLDANLYRRAGTWTSSPFQIFYQTDSSCRPILLLPFLNQLFTVFASFFHLYIPQSPSWPCLSSITRTGKCWFLSPLP